MNEKTCKTVRFYGGIILSAMTVIFGALIIWQVLDNYFTGVASGDKFIFSQTELFARFARISPAFWLWVIMIIACFVLCEVFPVKRKKSAYRDPCYELARLNKRIPAPSPEMVKRIKNVKILWLCCAVLGLAGIIYSIVYLAIPSHFTGENITHEVLDMAKNILPWAGVTFLTACGVSVYEGISAKRILPEARKLALGNKPAEVVHGKIYLVLHHKYLLLGVRIAVGCLAIAFIIAGSLNENVANVLTKAINICSECIGLG